MPGFSQPSNGSAPEVRLGTLVDGGLAPAIMAIVDRGVQRHPGQARALRLEVELQMEESYPPVRIVFGDDGVVVEDGPAPAPGLRIIGTLPDLAALMVAPLVGGLPNPIDARGRAAFGMFASRRVRIQGGLGPLRRFLEIVKL
ncbi:MAG: hypothetical protein ACLQA5_10225 [Solirubrobacteraceae bacterium]